jgi:competence protein ComEA
MVNINTATERELQTLPGIGPRKAATIVDHREAHGPFAAVEQLLSVNGIGRIILQRMRNSVTV